MPPFRILHSADWHLGARFHDLDRAADEEDAIDQVVALCREHQVDAVILAGDLFDTANPGAAEQRRYYRALLRLVEEGGVGAVVAIAGNHDSGARLDGPREVLAACRILVRGIQARDAAAEDAVLVLPRRDGSTAAVCAAVPYLREIDLDLGPHAGDLATRQALAMRERFAAIGAAARARAQAEGLPLVVAAHAFIRGGGLGGGERPVVGEVVGTLGQTDLSPLAEGAAYAALGHLHRQQAVGGHDHWRYSGSLLPTGFDEIATARSCLLAEVPAVGPAAVTVLPLRSFRRYTQVEGDSATIEAAIAALEPRREGEPQPLLAALVRLDRPHAGIAAQVGAWAAHRGWAVLSVRRLAQTAPTPKRLLAEAAPLRDLDPMTVLDAVHRQRHGRAPDEGLIAAFRTLLADQGGAG